MCKEENWQNQKLILEKMKTIDKPLIRLLKKNAEGKKDQRQ